MSCSDNGPSIDGNDEAGPLLTALCHPETEAGCRLLRLLGKLTFIYQPARLVSNTNPNHNCAQTNREIDLHLPAS